MVRARLAPWLGVAQSRQTEGSAALSWRFASTALPTQRMRLKVEINTREHFAIHGVCLVPFAVDSPWFNGSALLPTFCIEELLATKLRALYQRKKGRDLYDLGKALSTLVIDDARLVDCFEGYMERTGARVSSSAFRANLAQKLADRGFLGDIAPLLSGPANHDPQADAQLVDERLLARLGGAHT